MKALKILLTSIDNYIAYARFSTNPNTRRYWNRRLNNVDYFWRNENYEHIIPLLPKDIEFSLLDIGCAVGDGCELLHIKFPKAKITGGDISTIGIEKAIKKSKDIQYFVFDILKDPIPGIFDYITIIQTLEHFDDPFFVVNKSLPHARKAVIISAPYSSGYTGPFKKYGDHRYGFNKNTFTRYNSEVAQITPYIECTRERCIIYKVYPSLKLRVPKEGVEPS